VVGKLHIRRAKENFKMGRKRGSTSRGRQFDQDTVDRVWEKAKPIPGKDPSLYRKDASGNRIYKPSYGKDSRMGWEVDHKHPVSDGGSDSLRNLQPLQTHVNREKGDQYPWKPKK
jgi:5-methylcytosine-specific restriction endonuclease McrA